MTLALIIAALCFLLGMLACRTIPVLGWLHLPACVVAGFLALAWAQGFSDVDVVIDVSNQWSSWPGVLIAFVFAAMLLIPPRRSAAAPNPTSWHRGWMSVGREGLMVWIIVLGQTAVGCAVVRWFIQPITPIADAAGMLIETGFAGGHGTAAAMGEVFGGESISFVSGGDLGLTMATIGLVYGIVSGVVWVNLGIRRGWVSPPSPEAMDSAADHDAESQTDHPLGMDPWLLQAIWLLIAFGIGWGLQQSVGLAATWMQESVSGSDAATDSLGSKTELSAVIGSFPLFIYTLAGGLIVRKGLQWGDVEKWLDARVLTRQSSIVMDVLVVAAIGSLNLQAVAAGWYALTVLTIAGALWTAICLMVLSRHILPREHWFELGLINYGMSTGVTATGFVLLRMIDPKLQSGAAEEYALAAPLSSPFVGGGMITIGIPLLVLGSYSLASVATVLIGMVLALITIGIVAARQSAAVAPRDEPG